MGTQDLTFAFAGDERVGAGVSGLLEAAGYPATDISNADVVFTYCINTSALEDLYYDTEGLLRGSKEGAILVDLSPSYRFSLLASLMRGLRERPCGYCAPLVVSDMVCEEAFVSRENLGIVAGCREDADYKTVKPLLDAIAHRVMWMGHAGAGQKAKVAHYAATLCDLGRCGRGAGCSCKRRQRRKRDGGGCYRLHA